MSKTWAFMLIVAIAIAAIRIGGVTHIAYQASAHVFVGGLIGAAIAMYSWRSYAAGSRKFWYPTCLATFLSAVEVACFFAFKK